MTTPSALSSVVIGSLLDQISTAVWLFDIDEGHICWGNRASLGVWDAESYEELYARDMKSDMSPAVERRLKQYQSDFIAHNASFTETWTVYPKGVPRSLRVIFRGVRLNDGRMGMMCEAYEDHDLKPETLRSTDALLHTQLMIALHLEDGGPLYLNPAARVAFDVKQNLAQCFVRTEDYQALLDKVHRYKEGSITCQVHTSAGVRWHEITARSCTDPASGQPAYLVSHTDVSKIKHAENLAQELARRDVLTQLPNRLALPDVYDKMRELAHGMGGKLGMFFIDLDQFKLVNDALGHKRGDELLIDVARRLSQLDKSHATVATRLGGDEFLLLAASPGASALDDFQALAQEIGKLLSITLSDGNRHYLITPSIGIACHPDHARDLETLMQCADLAMYHAKLEGRNCATFFQSHMREARTRQIELLADLQMAFERDEFEVFYQPRYDAVTGTVAAVEALVRWQHPEKGMVSPGDFIPLCERTGLIEPLGELVLRRSLQQQCRLRDMGSDITVSVNVSLVQLGNPQFGQIVQNLLVASGCRPACLELELTETALVEAGDIVQTNLEQIRSLGVCTSIDDFGTGYSNLARLSEMALDCIKLDRSLIRKLPDNKEVVRMVIGLCRLMNATIVAEGIETETEAHWTRELGCHQLQGFLYARPMPAQELEALIVREHKG